jgi:hypothetical protein
MTTKTDAPTLLDTQKEESPHPKLLPLLPIAFSDAELFNLMHQNHKLINL